MGGAHGLSSAIPTIFAEICEFGKLGLAECRGPEVAGGWGLVAGERSFGIPVNKELDPRLRGDDENWDSVRCPPCCEDN